MGDHNVQVTRLPPFYPGLSAWGVAGADELAGLRTGGGGNVIYVGDSTVTHYEASDVNDGFNPLAPKATIQAALNACVNDYGDEIVIFPGNYTLTSALTVTKDRVRIFSWDYLRGESAPSVMIGSATDDFTLMTINADQVEIAGIRFANGSDIANNCISIGTTTAVVGCYIHDCKFAVGGGFGIEVGSVNGTVNDITIRRNTFIQIDDNVGAAGVYLGYVVRADVDSNLFLTDQTGTYGVSVRNLSTGGSVIRNNDFYIEDAGGTAIARGGAAADPFMTGNRVGGGPTNITAITQTLDGGICAVDNWVTTNAGGAQIDATT